VTLSVRLITEPENDDWTRALELGFNSQPSEVDLAYRRKHLDVSRAWGAFSDDDELVGTAYSFATPMTMPAATRHATVEIDTPRLGLLDPLGETGLRLWFVERDDFRAAAPVVFAKLDALRGPDSRGVRRECFGGRKRRVRPGVTLGGGRPRAAAGPAGGWWRPGRRTA
jgi:Acetyltransferase (GNAT) domain